MKKKSIFLVGSDTGGHVVPVFALAKKLSALEKYNVIVIGVGSDIEKRFYDQLPNVIYKKITAGKAQFPSFFGNLTVLGKLLIGFFQTIGLILKFRPRVVFLKGNYSTVPVAYAARLFFIPILAHESDAVLGKSNRLIGRFSKKLFLSYPLETYGKINAKTEYSGPILRDDFDVKNHQQQKNEEVTILVLGGSQGAHAINELIFSSIPEIAKGYKLIHQTGTKDIKKAEEIKNDLPKGDKDNYLPSAFISDNFEVVMKSDLIISRSSSSVFEYASFRKPVILIPYPHASLDHQAANAKFFADKNAALVFNQEELSSLILLSEINRILTSEKIKKELGENLFNAVKFGGEKVIMDEIIKYAEK